MGAWEWRVRGIGTTIVVRVASPLDNEPCHRGALDSFLFRLDRRTPEVHALARQILAAIGSPPLRPEGWERAFQAAARSGRLVFEEIPNTRVSIGAKSAFDAPTPDPAPGPNQTTKTPSDSAPTFFEVDVVDEIGEPIAGVPVTYDVKGETSVPTDGAGHTRLDGVTAQFGKASIDDLDALREAVRPRWDAIRDEDWIVPETDATFAPLHEVQKPQASILSETLHTLVIQPWVLRARLIGLYFDTNKCFLLPTAMGDIRQLKKLYDDNPDSELLVVGHTDTSGEPSINDPLSLERAKSVAAFLQDDVATWLDFYSSAMPWEKRWGTKEDHDMVGAMPDFATRPADEPPVFWFQRTRGLTVDGMAGPQTRQALITEYMALDETSLPSNVTILAHGCGENFPMPEGEAGSLTSEEVKQFNRRVELYFFDRKLGVQPPPPGDNSPPGGVEYPEWVRRSQETHDFELLRNRTLRIRVHDEDSKPLPDAFVRAHFEDSPQVRQADGDGFASFELPPACPALVLVEWGATSPSGPFAFSREFVPDCSAGGDEHLVRARLHNIGYEMDWPFEVAVDCFQADYQVDHLPEPIGLVNGTLPPATAALLEEIYSTRDCDATEG